MRIAFIGQKGIPATIGGVEKNVEKLATNFAERGHEVFVYVRNNYTEKKLISYKKIRLIHIPSISWEKMDTAFYSILATFHALFQRYDIIHYQGIGSASMSFLPKILNRKTKIFVTFYERNYLNEKWGFFGKKYLKLGEWESCNICNKTITPKKTIRSYVLSHYKKNISYIPSGAETKHNPETKALERWELKEKKYILSIVKKGRKKGIEKLIKTFKKLEDTNKIPNGFKLLIILEKFEKDEYLKNLYLLAEARSSIVFTSSQTRSALEQLYSHAYLFVQPSELPLFSMEILEAMGYGVAPMVSDIQENIETVGKCGFTFKTNSREDLEEKLAFLLNKPAEVKKMEKISKERIRKDFSWDSISRKILSMYESTQKNNKTSPVGKLQTQKSYV
jgi:glycosyltransferase involved in cell wall biosynthesis